MLPLHSMGEELRCEQPPVRQALQAFDREFAGRNFIEPQALAPTAGWCKQLKLLFPGDDGAPATNIVRAPDWR